MSASTFLLAINISRINEVSLGSLRAEQSLLRIIGDFFFHRAFLDFLPAGVPEEEEMEDMQSDGSRPTSFQ